MLRHVATYRLVFVLASSVLPLIAGYMTCGLLALAITTWAEHQTDRKTAAQ